MLPDDAGWLRERGMHDRAGRNGGACDVVGADCGGGTTHDAYRALAVRIERPGAATAARLR